MGKYDWVKGEPKNVARLTLPVSPDNHNRPAIEQLKISTKAPTLIHERRHRKKRYECVRNVNYNNVMFHVISTYRLARPKLRRMTDKQRANREEGEIGRWKLKLNGFDMSIVPELSTGKKPARFVQFVSLKGPEAAVLTRKTNYRRDRSVPDNATPTRAIRVWKESVFVYFSDHPIQDNLTSKLLKRDLPQNCPPVDDIVILETLIWIRSDQIRLDRILSFVIGPQTKFHEKLILWITVTLKVEPRDNVNNVNNKNNSCKEFIAARRILLAQSSIASRGYEFYFVTCKFEMPAAEIYWTLDKTGSVKLYDENICQGTKVMMVWKDEWKDFRRILWNEMFKFNVNLTATMREVREEIESLMCKRFLNLLIDFGVGTMLLGLIKTGIGAAKIAIIGNMLIWSDGKKVMNGFYGGGNQDNVSPPKNATNSKSKNTDCTKQIRINKLSTESDIDAFTFCTVEDVGSIE
ncbi:hypothetical protein WN51_08781 [Melipona quadrifasciata]|uniref:Uncharacterized protein n=1 Tax=Melipona quadrifasciata TaxID=166423 RepID=A0A0M8ZN55_9HYME|nr:hypothetical protein WN51_08781 [Melipona quadrifasciata]